ncbi:rod-determining factor RdfA [Halorarius litoreus]|uniref:rod-determining factor RdfA n=1 Tax=Halorarius litoreus TaxID=2962676 RepID=UPI0020CBDF63|nr:rod-determining factor RdfA [Halorarius litoreus]
MAEEGDENVGGAGERHRQSKVGRVIIDRDLGDIGAALEHHWTAEDQESMSLRTLADFFNQRVLRGAMEDAGMQVLDGEAENLYELLTGDDVSGGSRVQAKRRLEREGLDVGALMSDFVSHQAVHTYLTKYRGASAPASNGTTGTDSERITIQRLRNRLAAVVTNSLTSLRSKGQLTLGEFDVFVNIQIRCDDCGTQLTVSELFETGGCECDRVE